MLFRLSWLLLRRAYHVPRDSKVALFPIHLDPPTIQHRELFRLLLGQSRTSESCHRYPDPSVSSASSSAESVCGHGEDSKGGASTGNGEVSGGRSPMGSFCDGSWYLDELENHLRASSQLTPFDDIIVIPNTRSPVTLQRSTHLAALAVLGTRGIPHVHVDFTALEHPDETMPTMYELVCRYQRSTIVHWLHDAFEMQQWYQFTEIQKRAPLLLLQTNSLPVSAMGQPQRWLSTSHGRRRMAVQSGDAAAPSGEWWLSAGGPGDAEVEVSRSYLTKNGSAWLSPSLLTSQQSLNMDVESQRPRGGQNDLAHAASWGGADKAPIGDDLVVNEDGSLRIDNATAATLEAMVRRESEHPSTDASQGCSGVECELSAVQADLEDMLRPSQVLPVSTNLDEDVEAQEAESWMEFEDEDFVRSTHEAAAMDGLASSEEVGHHPTVRDLIMELFPAQSRCSVFSDDTGDGKVEVVCEGMDTALGAESGGATSSPTTPIQAPAAVAELMTSVPKVEVHSITRSTGADVRQAIWEQELDTNTILSTSVARYVDSHMLYRDSRKSTNATFFGHGAAPPPPSSNSTGGRSSTTPPSTNATHNGSSASGSTPRRVVAAKETATLGFQGAIPRLELHHDLGNPVACELYESLRIFECREDEEPDLIVPIGGDGYMMHCIRRNWRRFIPFFGVNAGHVGYLLNDRATLDELFSMPLKIHTTTMLYCEAERAPTISANGTVVKGEVLSELAFNDAWVERLSGQTALIRIMINGEERIQRLRGDGVLVATAAGSTAYSQALGASPVPVGAPLIQVVGSNVVSPAQWRPVHLDQEDQVEFEVLDHIKRPCRCFVDSVDVGNVTRMLVRSSRVALVSLAFSGSCDLSHKLYQVQFPKP